MSDTQRRGTTVRFDAFDRDLIAAAATAKGLSLPEYIARAARAAALQEQLEADRSDGGLAAYYGAVDDATAGLWHQME